MGDRGPLPEHGLPPMRVLPAFDEPEDGGTRLVAIVSALLKIHFMLQYVPSDRRHPVLAQAASNDGRLGRINSICDGVDWLGGKITPAA